MFSQRKIGWLRGAGKRTRSATPAGSAGSLLVALQLVACSREATPRAAAEEPLRGIASAASAVPAASAADPRLRFGTVDLATGIRMHYGEQGSVAGDPVLLLHGYSDSWFSFSAIVPHLPETLRVFALDQRGHGETESPPDGYHMRDLAADVIAFMDAQGLARATIVGHSMGSFVAQQVALLAPERVTGLVLIGSATTPRNIAGMSELAQAVNGLEDPVPTAFVRDFQMSTVHQPVPAAFMDRVVEESLKLSAHTWRALMEGMLATDVPTALHDNPPPTLIAWGDRDAFMLRPEQDALLALIPGSQQRVYPETGHTPHWERPEEFASDLAEFVWRTAQ